MKIMNNFLYKSNTILLFFTHLGTVEPPHSCCVPTFAIADKINILHLVKDVSVKRFRTGKDQNQITQNQKQFEKPEY